MVNIQKKCPIDMTPRTFEVDGDRYPDYRYSKARGKGRKPRREKGGLSLRSLNVTLFLAEEG